MKTIATIRPVPSQTVPGKTITVVSLGENTALAAQYAQQAGEQLALVEAAGAAQVALAAARAEEAAMAALASSFQLDNRLMYTSLMPGLDWNGTAGTGFSAAPTDPTRTTAKPACRLLVPPLQAFTDHLVVGVAAAANNQGDLGNLGLEKLVIHYEGNTQEITSPSFATFADANGEQRTYLGWWCTLLNDGRYGVADLYVEAVPRDPAMQSRVMGPYKFFPRAAKHDIELTIAPSQSVITGERYQDFKTAFEYLRSQTAICPLITVTEAGNYDFEPTSGAVYRSASWTTIRASVPITIRKASFTTDAAANLRPRYNHLCLRGNNITIDFLNIQQLFSETFDGATAPWWLDGIRLTNSGGRGALWRMGIRPVSWLVQASSMSWFTECEFTNLPTPCIRANLVRGVSSDNGYNDIFTDARCVVGTLVTNHSSREEWALDVPAMTVTYTGAEATATLALSGSNSATTRTFTAKYGANTATFAVQTSQAAWAAMTNYTFQNVADWLNGLPGWSATVMNNDRRAASASLAGLKGTAFGDTNVKNATLNVVSMFDLHSDWYQQNQVTDNVIVYDNVGVDVVAQHIFISPAIATNTRDFIFFNNALHRAPGTGYNEGDSYSQMGRSAHSHVVVAHNTLSGQRFHLRSQDEVFNTDAYCLVANNCFNELTWSNNTPKGAVVLIDNHISETGSAPLIPASSINTTVGGTFETMFAASPKGDFTPKGALLANPKARRINHDLATARRPGLASAGAVS